MKYKIKDFWTKLIPIKNEVIKIYKISLHLFNVATFVNI